MFLFRSKQPPIVGIDISSTSIKLLELSRSGSGFQVDAYAVEPLPDEAVNEKAIQDVEAVGEAIARAVTKSGTKAKLAAVAVPGSAVISKVITMPASLSEDEMETQIEIEADQYIPYPLEEINLDFEVIGPSEESEDTVDVLLAASKSENVEMRADAVELGGLSASVVDVEPYTVEHVCDLVPDMMIDAGIDRVVAVVDIGATLTSLNVIDNRKLIYTREQPFGGRQLTEEIMRRYGLSYEEAGRVKKQGGLPDNYEAEVLEPFKSTMAQQVSRFLQFFFSSGDHEAVDQILLAGGCAQIPGVEQFVEDHIGTPTTIINPIAGMALASRINRQRIEADASALLIACGLALRSYR